MLKKQKSVDVRTHLSGSTERDVIKVHDGEGVAPTALVGVDCSPGDDAFVAEVDAEANGERMQAELLDEEKCEVTVSGKLEATETAVTDFNALLKPIGDSAEVVNWDGFVEIDAVKDGLSVDATD